jgi:hypothetical protein
MYHCFTNNTIPYLYFLHPSFLPTSSSSDLLFIYNPDYPIPHPALLCPLLAFPFLSQYHTITSPISLSPLPIYIYLFAPQHNQNIYATPTDDKRPAPYLSQSLHRPLFLLISPFPRHPFRAVPPLYRQTYTAPVLVLFIDIHLAILFIYIESHYRPV